jgi:hypothetical protein
VPGDGFSAGLTGLGGAFLVLRAFSAGSVTLTGVETIASSVPYFRRPKARNAATTLLIMAATSIAMVLATLVLAGLAKVHYVGDPAAQLLSPGGYPLPDDYVQVPVISQLAQAVFHGIPLVFVPIVAVTGIILLIAATTSFGAVPELAGRLARDSYLPKQMYRRGDRRVTSHSVVALALVAIALTVVFHAEVTRLIQLYVVGVFASMAISQVGMVRHWNSELRLASTPEARRKILFARAVSGLGCALTTASGGVVLITKFTHGAWVTVLIVAAAYLVMLAVHRHYASVASDLAAAEAAGTGLALPPRVHGIVLVSQLQAASLRAISYARATRPSSLEVVTVGIDGDEVAQLRSDWESRAVPVSLTVLGSDSRDITRPVLAHVRSTRREAPGELVVVFIPEYIVRYWWERFLHNRSADRLSRGLRRIPGVVVASVPWQLGHQLGNGR